MSAVKWFNIIIGSLVFFAGLYYGLFNEEWAKGCFYMIVSGIPFKGV